MIPVARLIDYPGLLFTGGDACFKDCTTAGIVKSGARLFFIFEKLIHFFAMPHLRSLAKRYADSDFKALELSFQYYIGVYVQFDHKRHRIPHQ